LGFGLVLLLAAGFGAAHALTPGHGKTLVAAYLVGQRGTIGHAILLGVITTVTHTGVVIILAAMLPWLSMRIAPDRMQSILGFVGGFLVAGMGVWLLLRRLSGGADHVHIGGGHDHHHGPGGHHHHLPTGDRVRVWDLIVLGVTGGIVPCGDAIALLMMAIGTHQLRLGLPLLLAFSAGLAGVLVLIGVLVVKIKGFGSSRLGDGRIVRSLPIISAIVVTLLGIWLCFESLG
jgi:ABC-type nickel/cobalt efflux system permease component RcnA